MAFYQFIIPIFFILMLAIVKLSAANHVLKGSLTCIDCDHHSDLSGIKVLVKCSKVKNLAMATTNSDGSYETNLPIDIPTSSSPSSINCQAKILGGPHQLYTSNNNIDSNIIKVHAHGYYYYSTSKQLNFYKSCPLKSGNCGGAPNIDSSKTIDIPLPREWGLAPTSYYFPFIPIIGIP